MNELDAGQIAILGLIATITAGLVNLYLKKTGQPLGRRWITTGLFAFSMLLAYAWGKPLLPPFPAFPAPVDDPAIYAALLVAFLGNFVTFLGALIAAASSVTGFATLIYNTLLQGVLEKISLKIGWTAQAAAAQVEAARAQAFLDEMARRQPPK